MEPVVAKKPRTFVEETDIFDFSAMSKVADKAPLVIEKVEKKVEEKPSKPVKAPSVGASSGSKALADLDSQLGGFFQGKN